MNLEITARHFTVTEGLREHVLQKIRKFEKFGLKIVSARVVFDIQRFVHRCEIVLAGKKIRMTVIEKSPDLYRSLDAAIASLTKQLARYHEKIKQHHFKSQREVPAQKNKPL